MALMYVFHYSVRQIIGIWRKLKKKWKNSRRQADLNFSQIDTIEIKSR